MSMDPTVVVHPAAAAARLVSTLADIQARKGSASVVLTGGGTGIAVLEQVRRSPAKNAVDWSQLDIFWGDERFLPAMPVPPPVRTTEADPLRA